jgi:hypothetical protein
MEVWLYPQELAGLRWWYSTRLLGFSIYSLEADPTENTASNHLYIVIGGCLAIAPDIVDVFTGRYQATYVQQRYYTLHYDLDEFMLESVWTSCHYCSACFVLASC